MKGRHAVRPIYDVRVIRTLIIDERTITLIDIGGHDEVYR
jgi:mRNA-degrading endonuclease YafQ of YafQ-DinJ toxin-antitoxin module